MVNLDVFKLLVNLKVFKHLANLYEMNRTYLYGVGEVQIQVLRGWVHPTYMYLHIGSDAFLVFTQTGNLGCNVYISQVRD